MDAWRTIASSEVHRVVVRALGTFAVEVDGKRISAKEHAQRKPLALLKVLIACGPGGATVERLTDIVWPELDGDHAHQAFKVALHRLRRIVGTNALHSGGGHVWLDSTVCHHDVTEFETCAQDIAALNGQPVSANRTRVLGERMLAAYKGPFLDGDFSYPEFLSTRAALHNRFIGALLQTASVLERVGAVDDAVALFRRGLAVDGVAEDLCVALMECLRRSGRSVEALREGRRFVDALRDTQDAEPSPALLGALAELDREAGHPRTALPGVTTPDVHAPSEAGGPAASADGLGVRNPMTRRRVLWAGGLAALALPAAMTAPWFREWWRDGTDKAAALLEQDGFPRYHAPAVAVVPSGLPRRVNRDSDWVSSLSERLTSNLSVLPDIRVAAPDSVSALRSDGVTAKQLADALRVEYLVEFTAEKRPEQLQVFVRLVEGRSESIVWAHTFVFAPERLTDDPDALVLRMARAIAARLAYGPWEFMQPNSLLDDAESWERLVDALLVPYPSARTQTLRKIETYQALLQRFPASVGLLAGLAYAHADMARHHWTRNPGLAWEEAKRLAERANALDPRHARGRDVLAYFDCHHLRHAAAAEEIDRFIEAFPEDPMNHRKHAEVLMYLGRIDESLASIRRAAMLSPAYPAHLFTVLELDYYLAGRMDLAVAATTVALAREPHRERSWVARAAAEWARGNHKGAAAAAEALLRIRPDFRAGRHAGWVFNPMRDGSGLEDFRTHLLGAGLPA